MRKFSNIALISSAIFLLHIGVSAVTLKDAPLELQFAASISKDFSNVSLAQTDFDDQTKKNAGTASAPRKVSFIKAGLYSALIPGLGEYYVGHHSKARIFFAVEAATWVSFFTLHFYGNWKEDDFIQFAAENANANLENKSDEFRDWVGFYDDIDQFNSLGRVQDQERPYLVDNAENHWRWQSAEAQSTYRHLKNRSREAYRRRDFMVGLAIVNRFVSIIDAVRDARRARREIKGSDFSIVKGVNYRIEIDPFDVERPLAMSLFKRF